MAARHAQKGRTPSVHNITKYTRQTDNQSVSVRHLSPASAHCGRLLRGRVTGNTERGKSERVVCSVRLTSGADGFHPDMDTALLWSHLSVFINKGVQPCGNLTEPGLCASEGQRIKRNLIKYAEPKTRNQTTLHA